jgi:hypothetical protein
MIKNVLSSVEASVFYSIKWKLSFAVQYVTESVISFYFFLFLIGLSCLNHIIDCLFKQLGCRNSFVLLFIASMIWQCSRPWCPLKCDRRFDVLTFLGMAHSFYSCGIQLYHCLQLGLLYLVSVQSSSKLNSLFQVLKLNHLPYSCIITVRCFCGWYD